jgi:hypothetical protein
MKYGKVVLLFSIGAVTWLAGCANRKPAPVLESVIYPAIGVVTTRNVGEDLFNHGYGVLVPKLNISADEKIGVVGIPKGDYSFIAENTERIRFGKGPMDLYLYKDTKKICVAKDQCSDMKYTVESVISTLSRDSFQQTLIYNGKIGNRIALGYRESSGSIARPAFSNEVAYDLSESNVLGYKGARIEVVKATNTEITYKVISGFLQ